MGCLSHLRGDLERERWIEQNTPVLFAYQSTVRWVAWNHSDRRLTALPSETWDPGVCGAVLPLKVPEKGPFQESLQPPGFLTCEFCLHRVFSLCAFLGPDLPRPLTRAQS